jgi:hypothetical protein
VLQVRYTMPQKKSDNANKPLTLGYGNFTILLVQCQQTIAAFSGLMGWT